MSINDDLHAALKKYEALLAEKQNMEEETAAKSKRDSPEDIDLIDPFGLKEDLSPQNNQNTQDAIDDDPFADFVRVRTGSKVETAGQNKSSAVKNSKPEVEVKIAPKAPQQDEDDDPFASFVQQRATKLLSSSNQDVEKETKPAGSALQRAAPAKDLIDLWDGTTMHRHRMGCTALLTHISTSRYSRGDPIPHTSPATSKT